MTFDELIETYYELLAACYDAEMLVRSLWVEIEDYGGVSMAARVVSRLHDRFHFIGDMITNLRFDAEERHVVSLPQDR